MPVTRRRRANPPEEPENNNNHASEKEQLEQPVDTPAAAAPEPEVASSPAPLSASEQPGASPPTEPAAPQAEQPVEAPMQEEKVSFTPIAPIVPAAPATAAPPSANGDRTDRHEHTPPPPAEGVRRPVREAFRRPAHMQQQAAPQPVQPAPPPPPPAPAPLQPPSHEISLPLGNLLHLAYNPGYTGSDEARSALLTHLARESKAGGRARCWNCGSVAIVYERWNTRSKTFGEIGIAFCEICGVWSVM